MNKENDEVTPSRRDRLRPLELLGFSAVLAIFAAAIVAMVTRDWAMLVPITAGGVFIISAMGLALIGLGMKPNAEDVEARKDLQDLNGSSDDSTSDEGTSDDDGSAQAPNRDH